MDRSIGLLIIGLIFGGGIGFVTAASQGITLDGHDHSAHGAHVSHNAHSHEHDKPHELSAGADKPGIEISVERDPVSGWNLHVATTHFRFAPENAGKDHVAGEGHAHVYIDGNKIARLYGPWMHIGDVPAGSAELRVTLNANDHRPLSVDGEVLAASTTVPN